MIITTSRDKRAWMNKYILKAIQNPQTQTSQSLQLLDLEQVALQEGETSKIQGLVRVVSSFKNNVGA
jgi:hypothetical protein